MIDFVSDFYKVAKEVWASLGKKNVACCSYNVVPVAGRFELV